MVQLGQAFLSDPLSRRKRERQVLLKHLLPQGRIQQRHFLKLTFFFLLFFKLYMQKETQFFFWSLKTSSQPLPSQTDFTTRALQWNRSRPAIPNDNTEHKAEMAQAWASQPDSKFRVVVSQKTQRHRTLNPSTNKQSKWKYLEASKVSKGGKGPA